MAIETLQKNNFRHSGDQQTFYWTAGPRDGPAIIFYHGWPCNGELWKDQVLVMGSLGFRAVAPDTRGYGRSSVPGDHTEYRVEKHVSDMLALLAHLRRDKAVWVGHDWGAALVWALAAMHPDKCVGVVGVSVPYRAIETGGLSGLVSLVNREVWPEDEYPLGQWDYQAFHAEQPRLAAAQLNANVRNSLKALLRTTGPAHFRKPFFSGQVRANGGWWGPGEDSAPDMPFETTVYAEDKPAFERLVAELERNGFEGPNSYYRNHEANVEWLKGAANGGHLHFPVLFVHTKYDAVCDTMVSRLAEPMREACSDLTEAVLECGHWATHERPRELNAELVWWLATKLPHHFPGGHTTRL